MEKTGRGQQEGLEHQRGGVATCAREGINGQYKKGQMNWIVTRSEEIRSLGQWSKEELKGRKLPGRP